ncbi:MAG: LicD family protein [Muribaculaceae bacterium]|nr:LicD family protein [Muribaculaceae bacterium]
MELDKIKQVELDILKTTVAILDRHDIPYFISYGTCIGAIRHNGFIPWDDDIDISLFRKDYENARVILQKELPEHYIYCDRFTEEEFPYNFGKVRRKNTAFVHGGDAHLNISHGIYIDIFPLDDCYDSLADNERLINKIKRLRMLVDLKRMSYKKYGRLRPIWHLPLIFFAHAFVNCKSVQDKIDKLCKSVEAPSGKVCSFLTPYGTKDIYDKSWFGSGKKVLFEDDNFFVPENVEAYLTHIYGDYMQLPPVEKRVSHHDVVYSSTESEYHPQ